MIEFVNGDGNRTLMDPLEVVAIVELPAHEMSAFACVFLRGAESGHILKDHPRHVASSILNARRLDEEKRTKAEPKYVNEFGHPNP